MVLVGPVTLICQCYMIGFPVQTKLKAWRYKPPCGHGMVYMANSLKTKAYISIMKSA